jgi:hypothetical protein
MRMPLELSLQPNSSTWTAGSRRHGVKGAAQRGRARRGGAAAGCPGWAGLRLACSERKAQAPPRGTARVKPQPAG